MFYNFHCTFLFWRPARAGFLFFFCGKMKKMLKSFGHVRFFSYLCIVIQKSSIGVCKILFYSPILHNECDNNIIWQTMATFFSIVLIVFIAGLTFYLYKEGCKLALKFLESIYALTLSKTLPSEFDEKKSDIVRLFTQSVSNFILSSFLLAFDILFCIIFLNSIIC